MNCKTIHKNLIFFIEKKLPSEIEQQINLHLQQCNVCSSLYKEILATINSIDSEKKIETNPFFYTRLMQKIENIKSKKERIILKPAFIRIFQPTLYSVIVFLGISLGIWLGYNINNESGKNLPGSQASELQAYANEYYLNDFNLETIETFLLTDNNK